jgi:hypothetical protein
MKILHVIKIDPDIKVAVSAHQIKELHQFSPPMKADPGRSE